MGNKKYIKRTDVIFPSGNIYADYECYLEQENIFGVLLGHTPTGYRKAAYIWQALLKEYSYPDEVLA